MSLHPSRAKPATRSTGLQALAEIEANDRHSRRLAELQTLAPLLAQLDALMPSLTAQGLKVYPDQLGLGDTEHGPLDMVDHPAAAQARDDLAMPAWFWHLAPVALVGAIALSAVFPWGFAS